MRGRPVAVLLLLLVGACRTDGHVRAAPAHMLLLCAELEARKGTAGLRPSSRDRLGTGGCVRTGERTCGVPCCPAPQLGQHVRSCAQRTLHLPLSVITSCHSTGIPATVTQCCRRCISANRSGSGSQATGPSGSQMERRCADHCSFHVDSIADTTCIDKHRRVRTTKLC